MSSLVAAMVGCSRQLTSPAGAPAFWAASAMISAARTQQRTARGWGDMTTALPDLTAARALNSTVEVGLVRGMIPAMTPIGVPTAVIRFSLSTHRTPTARCPSMCRATNVVLYRFFRILCS